MRILIIANPSVGIQKEKREVIEAIASEISSKGGSADITYSLEPGTGGKYSSLAAFEGYTAVYAAGGDGTINDVASGLLGGKVPLGIVPLGTGNGFARGLGIPLDQSSYMEVLLRNKTIKIDAGKLSSHFFFSTAGISFDAHIARDFNKRQKSNRSIRMYIVSSVKKYFLTHSEDLTLIIDGKKITRSLFALTIANTSQYGGGAVIAPHTDPRNGKLTAVLIPKIGVFKALLSINKLFKGSVNKLKELEFIEFKSLKIIREKAGLYHVDGETYKGASHLTVTVLPSSLKVIVP